jgi:hypothetical protein
MAIPTTRNEFKNYCLRRLGSPMLDINVTPEQLDDRIDDAILYYIDYHHDGSHRTLYRHLITSTDITNGYFTTPESIISVTDVFPVVSSSSSAGGMFNFQYQLHLNDMFARINQPMLPYYTVRLQMAQLDEMFNGNQIFRWNRHVNRLHIDMDWSAKVTAGQYILLDCYQGVTPDEYTDAWGDRWLQRYATELIKRQWGGNLSKFENMQLPGGITFNGVKLYEEAQAELTKLEEEMINSYSIPAGDFVG